MHNKKQNSYKKVYTYGLFLVALLATVYPIVFNSYLPNRILTILILAITLLLLGIGMGLLHAKFFKAKLNWSPFQTISLLALTFPMLGVWIFISATFHL